ncbi:hypothetical protein GCM10010411_24150 [Actinomadura fulvescens]|uniref:Uncharacterized protein n=1 Tax=Actinomadura fulvescens TaxID=46160 RepID=A0ABP6BZD4_9ACTN
MNRGRDAAGVPGADVMERSSGGVNVPILVFVRRAGMPKERTERDQGRVSAGECGDQHAAESALGDRTGEVCIVSGIAASAKITISG